jgi:cyanate permease
MLCTSTLPGYAYSYFLPTILQGGLGFSTANAQLLTAPPYILAALFTFTSSWLADRYRIRGPLIALHQALTATGMLITAFAKGTGARLFGAYMGIAFLQF